MVRGIEDIANACLQQPRSVVCTRSQFAGVTSFSSPQTDRERKRDRVLFNTSRTDAELPVLNSFTAQIVRKLAIENAAIKALRRDCLLRGEITFSLEANVE